MPMKRGFRFERNYTCIGLGGKPCDAVVTKPDVRCGKCSHKYYLTVNRERDRQKNSERVAAHYEAHRDEYAERKAAHYRAHPDEYKERARVWKLDNPERAAASNRRSTANRREKVRAASSRWNKANPEVMRATCSRRRVRIADGMSAADRELSVAYRLAIAGDQCFYCGAPGEQDDHYQALAAGGTDHWWNLVRACESCNKRKSAMHGDQFRKLVMRSGSTGSVGAGEAQDSRVGPRVSPRGSYVLQPRG